jgi:hypothetical protein
MSPSVGLVGGARRHLWWMYLGFGALVCALYVFVPPL